MNQANRRYWDPAAPGWKKPPDQDQLWRQIPQRPELAFDGEALPMIHRYAGDLTGGSYNPRAGLPAWLSIAAQK